MFEDFGSVLLFTIGISVTFACNGYDFRDVEVKNCEDSDSAIILEDIAVELNEDCEFVVSGCVEVLNTISRGMGTMTIKLTKEGEEEPIVKENSMLMCPIMAGTYVETPLQFFNLARSCPIPAGRICVENEKMYFQGNERYLPIMVGQREYKIHGDTDGGEICLDYTYTVSKYEKDISNFGK